MFLADAVAGYIETLNERDFDAPFIALLYSQGFTNVHLTHGPLEFGKDFIARRTEQGIETQYVFQSKAGKISLSEWREVRGQIDSMRYGNVVHPDFDPRPESPFGIGNHRSAHRYRTGRIPRVQPALRGTWTRSC